MAEKQCPPPARCTRRPNRARMSEKWFWRLRLFERRTIWWPTWAGFCCFVAGFFLVGWTWVALNTSDASLGTAFNENQIKQLPIESRNVPDLLSLQAGVAYTGNRTDINQDLDSRSGSVNGAHSDQSNITLDGVDVNDETRGYAFTSVLPVSL